MLLADTKPAPLNPYASTSPSPDSTGATLRMARLYYDRYPWTLDWSNAHGKTALHIAALRGNEELVRMLCDFGADVDLADNMGSTPLHYASAWGHVPIVQLLIERGCQYTVKNNEGFTALDYAYSYSTREALQETVRLQFELNKERRRQVFNQAAARGNEWGRTSPIQIPPPVPAKDRGANHRLRSGSGTSRTTATSDSGDNGVSQASVATSSSPSRPSTGSSSVFLNQARNGHHAATPSSSSSLNLRNGLLAPNTAGHSAGLSPVANRMRERDADAMEKYLLRNRSGSSSTDNRSLTGSTNGSSAASATLPPHGEDSNSNHDHQSGSMTPRRLRPSFSAAQLRTPHETPGSVSNHSTPQGENRSRSGTNPGARASPQPQLNRSSSISNSLSPIISPDRAAYDEPQSYVGPPSQYAQFPEPPLQSPEVNTPTLPTNPSSRRKALHILGKPLSGFDSGPNHRRGMSATSVRGS